MFRSLHIAATGMSAQQTLLEGVSNNIANVNTNGFKKERIEFQDLLYQTVRGAGTRTSESTRSPTGIQLGSGVRVVGTSRSHEQGNILMTDNPLDVAIEGDGFFVVQQPDGSTAYTRAGALQKDAQGQLVTLDGHQIDQACADAELVKANRLLLPFPSRAQHVDVETCRSLQIDHAEDDMVDVLDIDHAETVRPSAPRHRAVPCLPSIRGRRRLQSRRR